MGEKATCSLYLIQGVAVPQVAQVIADSIPVCLCYGGELEARGVADYEYRGLVAEAWDALRGDTSEWADRNFYLALIQRFGEPVLDVGCGTGRLLLDYFSLGIDIDGVDNSPEMLAICREKAERLGLYPTLYEQFIEMIDLARRYRTILIPSSTIQLLSEPADVQAALRRLRAHLLPGGAIAASVMALRKEGDSADLEWEGCANRAAGGSFRRVCRSQYDPDTECEDTEDLYQVILDSEVIQEELHRRSLATRSYSQAQARTMFGMAGFRDVELYGEFTFEPVRPEDTLFVVVSRSSERLNHLLDVSR